MDIKHQTQLVYLMFTDNVARTVKNNKPVK